MLEIYSDYLISSFSYTTATGLSNTLDGYISHDKITRFLADNEFNSKDLWRLVKKTVRKIEKEEGLLIFDDMIQEKPYTDENDLITWHFDHSKGKSVKGVNVLYHADGISIPVAFELIKKTRQIIDKNGKKRKKCPNTKNEMYRNMLKACKNNQLKFKYVLNDVWYASSKNMTYVKEIIGKDFIMPIKKNRKIALSIADKKNGHYIQVRELDIKPDTEQIVFLEGLKFPLKLIKKVFKNKDNSEGIQYLVSSDNTLTNDKIWEIYHKRWKIEEYHKSLKNNSSFGMSPTKIVITQSNHFFASIYAVYKLELLKIKTHLNHFALRSKIYIKAIKEGLKELFHLRFA